jgi:DNA/RNA endonuclease G (NUC1)/S1-C subfamily serine protease
MLVGEIQMSGWCGDRTYRRCPMSERQARARQFLDGVSPTGSLEAALDRSGTESLESMVEANRLVGTQRELVRSTIEKMVTQRELSPAEQFTLEAIIIPDKRPAVDVINGDFEVRHALWQHYRSDPIHARIRAALRSIGRIEVFGIPSLPYGGTGFAVGEGLIMTNRHVAELVAAGVGRRDLVFRPGLGCGVDFKRERDRDDKQFLRVRGIEMIHPYWDMALLRVDGLSGVNPPLVLSLEDPDQLNGRDVAVVGYPAFDPRNPADVQNQVFGGVYYVKRLQPGKLGIRRSVQSFGHTVSAMTHDASTLGGNSGSAVVDAATGRVVALHFAGVYLDANFTVPAWELARDRHVVDTGVRFERAPQSDQNVTRDWWRQYETVTVPPRAAAPADAAHDVDRNSAAGTTVSDGVGVTVTIPLHITIRLGEVAASTAVIPSAAGPAVQPEKVVEPMHDSEYSIRPGYAEDFLGIDVPLPDPLDGALCAPLIDGGHTLHYHHFSLVMHRRRRLALFTAANVDGRPGKRKPDPTKSYTRKALGGLGPKDTERWFTDPRLASEFQLPDRFFTKDRGAFDRGHIVRREDVAWGDSYQEVRFANGDTYHTTNCSPQVAGFNQAEGDDNWGDLERYVAAQVKGDRLTIFAGPVLADDDPTFLGVDEDGPISIQIPRQYWKLIVAEDGGALKAFAFVLRQDLTDVPLEFAVDSTWRKHMVTVAALEELVGTVHFPDVVRAADQAETDLGEAVRRIGGMTLDGAAGAKVSGVGGVVQLDRPAPHSADDEEAEQGVDRTSRPPSGLEAVPWRAARSLLVLRRQIDGRAPRRDKSHDGTIGDAAHATRNSDHNPWVMDGTIGVVTAMDITHDPANGCDAGLLAAAIRASRDGRVKYVIWNRQIANASPIGEAPAWAWRPYTGANPHSKHVHISVRPEAMARDAEAEWAI